MNKTTSLKEKGLPKQKEWEKISKRYPHNPKFRTCDFGYLLKPPWVQWDVIDLRELHEETVPF